jgi:hypothetical protein
MWPGDPKQQLETYSPAYPNEQPRLVVHYLDKDFEEDLEPTAHDVVRALLQQVFEKMSQGIFDPGTLPELQSLYCLDLKPGSGKPAVASSRMRIQSRPRPEVRGA